MEREEKLSSRYTPLKHLQRIWTLLPQIDPHEVPQENGQLRDGLARRQDDRNYRQASSNKFLDECAKLYLLPRTTTAWADTDNRTADVRNLSLKLVLPRSAWNQLSPSPPINVRINPNLALIIRS